MTRLGISDSEQRIRNLLIKLGIGTGITRGSEPEDYMFGVQRTTPGIHSGVPPGVQIPLTGADMSDEAAGAVMKWAQGKIPRARIAGSSLEGGMSDLYKETSEPYRELDDWRNSQNPLSVIQGKDVNSMVEQTRPPEQQADGDGQSLQAILGQEEYNPDSGMTYQEWLEWKLANSRSLNALGKITGVRMPRAGQRR